MERAEERANLLGNELVLLVEDRAALGVTEDDPLESNVLELLEAVAIKRVRTRSRGRREEDRRRTRPHRCRHQKEAGERSGRRP